MEKENRYFVLKWSDLQQSDISLLEKAYLESISNKVQEFRKSRGKTEPFECIVVESDWPEYNKVWKMIVARCEGKSDSKERSIREKMNELEAEKRQLKMQVCSDVHQKRERDFRLEQINMDLAGCID